MIRLIPLLPAACLLAALPADLADRVSAEFAVVRQ